MVRGWLLPAAVAVAEAVAVTDAAAVAVGVAWPPATGVADCSGGVGPPPVPPPAAAPFAIPGVTVGAEWHNVQS